MIKGRVVWVLETYLISIEPYWVNGVGALRKKRGLYGKKVISRKYGVEVGGWCTQEVRNGYSGGFWIEIRKE